MILQMEYNSGTVFVGNIHTNLTLGDTFCLEFDNTDLKKIVF